ncbi:hypothetical protein QN277_022427 [Acacia crassicarpa]|uniref:LOB domain-containing protein n=1 Tax=Acacia crassicarpa TaxID=499986 RepID=A0AAE1JF19_9FABA|nr:hypothetical protein QN277_022427 [Acacia crassicarpa]
MNVVRNTTNNNTINNHNQACAACKYQRKKCAPDCILAPYFPHDRQRQFLNAHRLFGVRNITRIIENYNDHLRDEAMRSIIYQSDMRAADPVGGCYRHVKELMAQIQYLEAELVFVRQQLAVFRAQARHHHHPNVHEIVDTTPNHSSLYSPNNVIAPVLSPVSYYQYLQQQQEPMHMAVVNNSHQDHRRNNNDNDNVPSNLNLDDVNYWLAQDPMSLSFQNKNGGGERIGFVEDELDNDHKPSLSSLLNMDRDDRF